MASIDLRADSKVHQNVSGMECERETLRRLPPERCGDVVKLNAALDRLEEMAVVKRVECDPNYRAGRVIAWSLW